MLIMNRIIQIFSILAACALAGLTHGCTSEVDGIYGSFPYLEIEENSFNVGCEDTTIHVNVLTNRSIKVSSNQQWITANTARDRITITVRENTSESGRTAIITVKDSKGTCSRNITVHQDDNGIHSNKGNTLLQDDGSIEDFVKIYNRIDGNLLLGYTGDSDEWRSSASPASETDSYSCNVGGKRYDFVRSASIRDISPIEEGITEITGSVHIILNSRLDDLSPLFDFGITDWTLVGNDMITSIRPLTDLGIERLTIQHSPMIEDFDKIGDMTSLDYLDLSKNELDDISFLEDLHLTTLILGSASGESNAINDISPLFGMTTLEKLTISGLPVPQSQIDSLRHFVPGCDVTAQNMPNELPSLGGLTFDSDATGMTLSCRIEETATEIISKGFYFGADADNMDVYIDESDGNSINCTLTGLDSSSYYYAYAFAVAGNNLGTVTTERVQVYTRGRTVFDGIPEISSSSSSISVTGTMLHPGDPETVEFGTLLGVSGDLSLDNWTEIASNTLDKEDEPMPYTWTDRISGLTPGTYYYVRTYAIVEGMGITYSEPQKVSTAGTPDMPCTFFLNVDAPAWADPDDADVFQPAQMFGYYFRDDITGSGTAITGNRQTDNLYSFSFPAGVQDIVFSSLEGSTPSSGNGLLEWRMTGSSGLSSDLLVHTLTDEELTGNVQQTAVPERVSTRISSLTFSYFDETGVKYGDLSSVISGIRVTATGVSTAYTLNSDFTGTYSGNGTVALTSGTVTDTDTQVLAEGLHVLPSSGNEPFAFTVSITFLDGTSVTRAGSFKSLRANCDYSLAINLYDFTNETGNSFTVDVIQIKNDVIEF